MTRATSRAWSKAPPPPKTWPRKNSPAMVARDEQRVDLRPADRADAHRHADLDRARPHRAQLSLRDDRGADRSGGAQAVHRDRELRDHGDPVLHPGRQLPDAWWRRPPHDPLCHHDGRPSVSYTHLRAHET